MLIGYRGDLIERSIGRPLLDPRCQKFALRRPFLNGLNLMVAALQRLHHEQIIVRTFVLITRHFNLHSVFQLMEMKILKTNATILVGQCSINAKVIFISSTIKCRSIRVA